ncbi:hypothetical protein B0H19DRAFT_1384847 [Mycena capillaripes]|nr:hypothetical protein B0H19DRAFT_1384847 [Mycena capillaripes]
MLVIQPPIQVLLPQLQLLWRRIFFCEHAYCAPSTVAAGPCDAPHPRSRDLATPAAISSSVNWSQNCWPKGSSAQFNLPGLLACHALAPPASLPLAPPALLLLAPPALLLLAPPALLLLAPPVQLPLASPCLPLSPLFLSPLPIAVAFGPVPVPGICYRGLLSTIPVHGFALALPCVVINALLPSHPLSVWGPPPCPGCRLPGVRSPCFLFRATGAIPPYYNLPLPWLPTSLGRSLEYTAGPRSGLSPSVSAVRYSLRGRSPVRRLHPACPTYLAAAQSTVALYQTPGPRVFDACFDRHHLCDELDSSGLSAVLSSLQSNMTPPFVSFVAPTKVAPSSFAVMMVSAKLAFSLSSNSLNVARLSTVASTALSTSICRRIRSPLASIPACSAVIAGAAVAAAYDGHAGAVVAAIFASAAAAAAAVLAVSTNFLRSRICASSARRPSFIFSAVFVAMAYSPFNPCTSSHNALCPSTIPSANGDSACPTDAAISFDSVSPISSPKKASAHNVWLIDFSVVCGSRDILSSTENSSVRVNGAPFATQLLPSIVVIIPFPLKSALDTALDSVDAWDTTALPFDAYHQEKTFSYVAKSKSPTKPQVPLKPRLKLKLKLLKLDFSKTFQDQEHPKRSSSLLYSFDIDGQSIFKACPTLSACSPCNLTPFYAFWLIFANYGFIDTMPPVATWDAGVKAVPDFAHHHRVQFLATRLHAAAH